MPMPFRAIPGRRRGGILMNTLWENIFRNRKKKDGDSREILVGIPVFEDLSGRELSEIQRIMHRRQYRPGEVIFQQGTPGLGMYVIVSGEVDILCDPESHTLAELKDGEFFGELALLDDSPRTATARAKTACTLLCLFQPDLLDLVERNPRLGVRILVRLARTIGARLRRTNEQLTSHLCRAADAQ